MKKPIIGIIGFGYVGRAIHHGFAQLAEFRIHDINPILSENTLDEVLEDSDYIFLCLPTPMKENGECDISIVNDLVHKCARKIRFTDKILIIKSTIPPGTTQRYIKKYPGTNIVFNPEFLTARSAKLDFINSARIILGGKSEDLCEVEKLYRLKFPHTQIFWTDSTTAELVKYTANCFFSVKVSFFNEIYQLCKKLKLDYNEVKKMVLADQRIGNSHMDVPGHDGKRGFGGSCFPKDLNAMIHKSKQLKVKSIMMEAAWKKNLECRKKL